MGKAFAGIPLFIVLATSDVVSTEEAKTILPNGLKEASARQHAALNEFVRGNVAPWNDVCSQADDDTIVAQVADDVRCQSGA